MKPQYYTFEDGVFVIVDGEGYDPETLHPLPDGFWTEDGQQAMDWDADAGAIVELLVPWRVRIWAEVKARRDAAMAGGCMTPAGPVQTDERSRALIDGYALEANLNPAFERAFTLADNSKAVLDAAGIAAVKLAVSDHVAAVHGWSQGLRAQIEAAASIAELLAIDIMWETED